MKAFIVILAVLMALVGAASADTVSINGNYVWNGGTAIVGTNLVPGVTFQSGMDLKSTPNTALGLPAAESTVANSMTLGIAQNPQTMIAPVSASQSGGNTVTVNNGQEPGSTNPQIWDFQSTSNSGGQVSVASEGMGSGQLTPSTPAGTDVASTFNAQSTGTESSYGFLLNHNVVATDTNLVSGSVVIDPITVPGTSTTSGSTIIMDHVSQNIPSSGNTVIPDAHIKDTTYNWNCIDAANVKYEDCYNKDTTFTSGISVGAVAVGEVSPTANGINGATSAYSVSEAGSQNIKVQTSNYGTT